MVVFSSLFDFERKVSVSHVACQRTTPAQACTVLGDVKSKTGMLVQLGFRRLMVSPVFSAPPKKACARKCEKLVYKRYFEQNGSAMASFFAPIYACRGHPQFFWLDKDSAMQTRESVGEHLKPAENDEADLGDDDQFMDVLNSLHPTAHSHLAMYPCHSLRILQDQLAVPGVLQAPSTRRRLS